MLLTSLLWKATGLVKKVNDLTTAMSGKADTTALAAKADATTVAALQTTVDGKANTSAVTALESEVDTLTQTVAGKADATALNGKADTSTVTTIQNTIGDSNSGMVKQIADLQASVISLQQQVTDLLGRVDALEGAGG